MKLPRWEFHLDDELKDEPLRNLTFLSFLGVLDNAGLTNNLISQSGVAGDNRPDRTKFQLMQVHLRVPMLILCSQLRSTRSGSVVHEAIPPNDSVMDEQEGRHQTKVRLPVVTKILCQWPSFVLAYVYIFIRGRNIGSETKTSC